MKDFAAYAPYIWGSFAATALVFGWNVAVLRLGRRDVLRRLKNAGTVEPQA